MIPQKVGLEYVGAAVLSSCEDAGHMIVLTIQSLRELRFAGLQPHRMFIQMKRIGLDTLFIAAAIALFIGMVLGLHSGYSLRKFDFEQAMASIVALSIVKEMGPVITGLLLAGRIGASISAELGTMQVNEEIDALHTLGISPVRYLVMPRFLGCVTMMPALVAYASLVGIFGGAIVAAAYFDITFTSYFKSVWESMGLRDLMEGQIKSVLFGGIIAIVSCHRGLSTRGGAEGVGNAITSCVVTSFICIIICDYFVTRFLL